MKYSEVWKNGALRSSKHQLYLDKYNDIFEIYENKKIKILEFGVSTGGSLESYANYFSPESTIVGVDLDTECSNIEFMHDNISIVIGDMTDSNIYKMIKNTYGKFDIIIDDGGHTNFQMHSAFIYGMELLNSNSIYVAEDTHCSYLTKFGNPSMFSFMSYAKSLIDKLSMGHVIFKNSLILSELQVIPGMCIFKYTETSAGNNPQVYNTGKVTVNAKDQRFESNSSTMHKNLLSMYSFLSNTALWRKINNIKWLSSKIKKIYALLLLSGDVLKTIKLRRSVRKEK
jgi:hypothetical protein